MRVLILYKQAHWVFKLQKMIMYGIQNWLVVSTPLKNMKVSWDDYSQYMESHKIHVPNHQPDVISRYIYHKP
jgi:hypothetical protein